MDDKYFPTTTVRPVRTEAEFNAVRAAALTDNHNDILFTHYVVKGGEIVGALNIERVVFWWLDSKKCNRDDTRQVLCALMALLAQAGLNEFSICCEPASPYFGLLEEKFGCKKLNLAVFHRSVPHV